MLPQCKVAIYFTYFKIFTLQNSRLRGACKLGSKRAEVLDLCNSPNMRNFTFCPCHTLDVQPMIQYRIAQPSDALALLQTRRKTVLDNQLGLYPPAVLQAWAPQITTETIGAEVAALQGDDRLSIVAEEEGRMLGFCSLGLSEGLLKQCYVLSECQGQGLAKHLVKMAEEEAVARGITCLRLSASLIALGFYERMGYQKMYDYLYELGPGLSMPCVMMEKYLPDERATE